MVLKWTPFYIKTAHGLHKKNPDILNPLKWTAGAGVLGDGKINIKRCSPPPSGLYVYIQLHLETIFIYFNPFVFLEHRGTSVQNQQRKRLKRANFVIDVFLFTSIHRELYEHSFQLKTLLVIWVRLQYSIGWRLNRGPCLQHF